MDNRTERLTQFEVRGELRAVTFIETVKVREGVECDVYEFDKNKDEDLGIIRVSEDKETPKQRINLDLDFPIKFTEEGFVSGNGVLSVDRYEGKSDVYEVNSETGRFSTLVYRGDEMKWRAGKGGLVAYEVCSPPYREGRFEDLD